MTGEPATPQATDALEEARQVVEDAGAEGITVRLLGGLAVRALCPEFPPRTTSPTQDLDLASVAQHRKPLSEFLLDRGYVGDKTFNALYGHKQMYFQSPTSGRPVDVLIDRLEMCHVLEFAPRIERRPLTLSVLDVLLSKLQIVELNEKDARDAIYLLSAYPVEEGSQPGTIELDAFRELMANDWGWWRTVTMNLERLASLIASDGDRLVPGTAPLDPAEQIARLAAAAEEVPKALRWRVRARVGDRVRWYQEPEESTHH